MSELPACPPDQNAFFSVPPLANADFTGLAPLGNLNPPSHTFPTDHLYFFVRRDGSGAASVPVVSPGAVTLWRIETSEAVSANPPRNDFTLRFAPCSTVSGYFNHVQSLDAGFAARLGPLEGMDCDTYNAGGLTIRNCARNMKLEIAAGEVIGTAGSANQAALDFGLADLRLPALAYANPSRTNDEPAHAVCPIDYFEPAVRAELRARFSDALGTRLRTADPVCGEIEHDEPGTAQGRWYVAGTKGGYPEDPHLALVHDNVDPTIPLLSVGTSVPGLAGTWTFRPATSGTANREFRDVVPGSVACWDASTFGGQTAAATAAVLVEMPSPTELRIEARAGARCDTTSQALTASAVAFER